MKTVLVVLNKQRLKTRTIDSSPHSPLGCTLYFPLRSRCFRARNAVDLLHKSIREGFSNIHDSDEEAEAEEEEAARDGRRALAYSQRIAKRCADMDGKLDKVEGMVRLFVRQQGKGHSQQAEG